jgi:hypothetical protein
MNSTASAGLTIVMAIIGVATLSVILSRNANTTEVIKAASGGLSGFLNTAISPIGGNTFSTR